MEKCFRVIHKDRREVLGFCNRFDEIYIYGAGEVAEYFYDYLTEEGISINGIFVSNGAKDTHFYDLPVYDFGEAYSVLSKSAGIILAVNSSLQKEILPDIISKGLIKRTFAQRQKAVFKDAGIDEAFLLDFKEQAKEGYFSDVRELDSIGKDTGTDKCSEVHNYLNKYEFFLHKWKDSDVKLLELGVFEGASLQMWKKYLSKGEIIGVDINPDCQKFTESRITIRTVNLSHADDLKGLTDIRPDIIVDDASHMWSHQLKALFVLFPSLSHGGVYILEDLETNFPSYRFNNYDDAAVSPYDFLSALAEIVTSRERLRLENKHPAIAHLADTIEQMGIQIEMISFLHGSCVMIKR